MPLFSRSFVVLLLLASAALAQKMEIITPGGRRAVPEGNVIGITIDGGGVALTPGVKGYLQVPFNCTITGWTLLADQTGSIAFDIWKDTYANFPPIAADVITAVPTRPFLSVQNKGTSTTLTSWTTTINAGDVLAFYVDSAATLTRATLTLSITRR
jgi:hypothetical protein